jgi:gas vesicle protein
MKFTRLLAVIGLSVAAGVLLAPHSGKKSRKKIRKRLKGMINSGRDKVDHAAETANEAVDRI